jgi:hypothetical protein
VKDASLHATRRIRKPPTDAEIERGLRERAVSDLRAAEISFVGSIALIAVLAVS